MSSRYIVKQPLSGRSVPRCDLYGSPFASRRAAKLAASRAGIVGALIGKVRRSYESVRGV